MEIESELINIAAAGLLRGAVLLEPELFTALPGTEDYENLLALAELLTIGEVPAFTSAPARMVSIFDRIALPGRPVSRDAHALPLKRLALQRQTLFPSSDFSTPAVEERRRLLEPLATTAQSNISDGPARVEGLLAALQQSAWRVPAGCNPDAMDVSLYDHSRMTAALAVCLSKLPAGRLTSLRAAVEREFARKALPADGDLLDSPAVLLVGGDISGVQDFIYTISSKNAAKTLRGRSFYLQLLTEAVLRFTLKELGLPYTNVIYSGGGHFYLLAPLSAAELLPGLKRSVSLKLLRHHHTDLYLAIGAAQAPFSAFRLGEFSHCWAEMHRSLSAAKSRRYTELGDELFPLIFTPPDVGGDPNASCSVCGSERFLVNPIAVDQPDAGSICTLCGSFADDLGRPLPQARFVVLGWGPAEDRRAGKAADALASFGMQVGFASDGAQIVSLPGSERASIWALDDPAVSTAHTWPLVSGLEAAHWLRYTVNRIPRDPSEALFFKPLEFDKLAEKVNGGFERLGVLRMDVDNLGEVFKDGLAGAATLARLSTLSFQMSLFFEGWVKQLWEGSDFEDLIYAVYAGGDDVFLIGPWDRMPDLARTIRDDFAAFTGDNPSLTVSGGMAFIGGKYPVYQAAEDAADELELAKRLDAKNAFSFLGCPWSWSEFKMVADKFEHIRRIVGREPDVLNGPQALIGVLRRLAVDESNKALSLKMRPVWGRWMWRGAYLLKRMLERAEKTNPDLAQSLSAIQEELAGNNYADLQQWGFAARWVQLAVREKTI